MSEEIELTCDQATEIEDNHNVYVDAETAQYNHKGHDETYGWHPIPQSWIDELC